MAEFQFQAQVWEQTKLTWGKRSTQPDWGQKLLRGPEWPLPCKDAVCPASLNKREQTLLHPWGFRQCLPRAFVALKAGLPLGQIVKNFSQMILMPLSPDIFSPLTHFQFSGSVSSPGLSTRLLHPRQFSLPRGFRTPSQWPGFYDLRAENFLK